MLSGRMPAIVKSVNQMSAIRIPTLHMFPKKSTIPCNDFIACLLYIVPIFRWPGFNDHLALTMSDIKLSRAKFKFIYHVINIFERNRIMLVTV